jgi:hypothetical protein
MYSFLINRGKISVGEKLVKSIAKTNRIINIGFTGACCRRNHNPTPDIAIIYVGDSEELLKITTKIKTDAK